MTAGAERARLGAADAGTDPWRRWGPMSPLGRGMQQEDSETTLQGLRLLPVGEEIGEEIGEVDDGKALSAIPSRCCSTRPAKRPSSSCRFG